MGKPNVLFMMGSHAQNNAFEDNLPENELPFEITFIENVIKTIPYDPEIVRKHLSENQYDLFVVLQSIVFRKGKSYLANNIELDNIIKAHPSEILRIHYDHDEYIIKQGTSNEEQLYASTTHAFDNVPKTIAKMLNLEYQNP